MKSRFATILKMTVATNAHVIRRCWPRAIRTYCVTPLTNEKGSSQTISRSAVAAPGRYALPPTMRTSSGASIVAPTASGSARISSRRDREVVGPCQARAIPHRLPRQLREEDEREGGRDDEQGIDQFDADAIEPDRRLPLERLEDEDIEREEERLQQRVDEQRPAIAQQPPRRAPRQGPFRPHAEPPDEQDDRPERQQVRDDGRDRQPNRPPTERAASPPAGQDRRGCRESSPPPGSRTARGR